MQMSQAQFIESRQIQFLYDNAVSSSIGIFVITLVISLSFVDAFAPAILIGWTAYVLLVAAHRILLHRQFIKSGNVDNYALWGRRFTYNTLASGVGWLLLTGALSLTDNEVHEVSILLIIIGIQGASVPILSAYLPAFFASSLPSILMLNVMFHTEFSGLQEMVTTLTFAWFIFILLILQMVIKDNRNLRKTFTLEFENRQMVDSLSAEIDERKKIAGELRVAKDKAEQASLLKSRFLANMSHELRTPMNGIIGMSYLALKAGLPEKQRGYIEKLRTSAEGMLGLLNDILDFTKIESDRLELENEVFEFREVMDTLMDMISIRNLEKRLDIKLDIDAKIPARLSGDALRLRQILLNLGSNAVKFTDAPGSVTISARQLGATGDTVTLSFMVEDTGIGIQKADLDRLFESFTQSDASTTRKYGGTGLGLAISRQLTRLMGGQIGCDSEPGKGSTFHFTLQFKLVDQADSGAGERGEDSGKTQLRGMIDNLSGTRILLVEDNEINQELVKDLLEQEGALITVAGNGSIALELLEEHNFDAILMDCQMPVMDGYEATRQIRAWETHADLPIIALTANAMKGDREKVLAAGMNDHVAKPVDPEALIDTLVRWIGRGDVESRRTTR